MVKVQKRTFSLSEEQAGYIDSKVASGGYVSGSEVIREGLRVLQERDAALERSRSMSMRSSASASTTVARIGMPR